MSNLATQDLTLRGENYTVRELKGTERFKCADVLEKEGNTGMAGFVLKKCVLKPEKFNFDEEPAAVCEALFQAVIKLSGFTSDAFDETKKNSDPATNAESGTD